ncbi:MAG: putative baseplate assembly protein, partial [Deltaproteobacteria bacterium]|nr:putative baseplate assembly protein [Deltaproteobacteria bacterium]
PEIIFETERDVVVSSTRLVKCIAFDPLNYSDRTPEAGGGDSASSAETTRAGFAAFRGEKERRRALYIGHGAVFAFPDEATRKGAVIQLHFQVKAQHGSPDWRLLWEYYDENAADRKRFSPQPEDETRGLLTSGFVTFTAPPEIGEHTITQNDEQWTSRWIRALLTGGADRTLLPVLDTVRISRSVRVQSGNLLPDLSYYNPIESAAYIPLDLTKEFYPLGRRPCNHDTFYMAADEPLAKPGATVTLTLDIGDPGVASEEVVLTWEYYDGETWQPIGRSSSRAPAESTPGFHFRDTSRAFTLAGRHEVSFVLPDSAHPELDPSRPVTVNGEKHHWLRVRMTRGLYGREGYWDARGRRWVPEVVQPPALGSLRLGYTYRPPAGKPGHAEYCLSQVDSAFTDRTSATIEENTPFSPFSAAEEGPALYMGFKPAFPRNKWIQLLLDVQEEAAAHVTLPPVFWEYWNGSRWAALRASDGSRGLKRREYLGFFGPEDHKPRTEFGQEAYWLRGRPHLHPLADAGGDGQVSSDGETATVSLDASRSLSFDESRRITRYTWRLGPLARAGQDQKVTALDGKAAVTLDAFNSEAFGPGGKISTYTWRIVSSSPPTAEAGPDRTIVTEGQRATVSLNGANSRGAEDRPIAKYIWSRAEAEARRPGTRPIPTPFLKAIRLNTAPALNAVTIRNEALGSSDGKPNQVFTLKRPPVLPELSLAVREPDRPPSDELSRLQEELRSAGSTAGALLEDKGGAPGQGIWIRWTRVSDFHGSAPSSRHFTLDAITGDVRFGDGEQGKIPPVGRDNIRALIYRNLDGAKANAPAGAITALRNPSGDLANIKSATNPEPAAGGSDSKPVSEVKERGPQSLKHRRRAVTSEDFVWLAREASGEVARAACLPVRNATGLEEPGWVTVVITPESRDTRPTPPPALLRRVEGYLKDRVLANLKAAGRIYVTGPEYIEAAVEAQVVPEHPDKADAAKLAVLKRLETFLHPLLGGVDRRGWELGRDVYLSEVCAEVEEVPEVDHVALIRLLASIQQFRLEVGPKKGARQQVPLDAPVGSQVGTFDERIKLLLAEPLRAGEELRFLAVSGFKSGDRACLVGADNSVVKENLRIASISGHRVTFTESFVLPEKAEALSSEDRRLRLPISARNGSLPSGVETDSVAVRSLEAGEKVSIVAGTLRHPGLEFLPILAVSPLEDRIFVPEGHLIYSGGHDIKMVLE